MVTFALGTDTAGCGRVPATLNGIVGFKPTKGTILDDYDAEDAYAKPLNTLPLKAMDYRGVADGNFTFTTPPPEALDVCHAKFRQLFSQTTAKLISCGGRFVSLSADDYAPFVKASGLLYTGTLVNEHIACIALDFINANLDNLHPTTRQLFIAVLSRDTKLWDVFADQITQAQCTRKAQQLFGKIDVMILPCVPYHPTIAEMDRDPVALNARMGQFTHFANVLDLCGVNINATFYESEHGTMPFGISLLGETGMDGRVADIAEHLETRLAAKV